MAQRQPSHSDDYICSDSDCALCAPESSASVQCTGHIEDNETDFARLLQRYGDDKVGFVVELAKLNGERKLMHNILNAYGIPSENPEGKGLCLPARLAILSERLAKAEWYGKAL